MIYVVMEGQNAENAGSLKTKNVKWPKMMKKTWREHKEPEQDKNRNPGAKQEINREITRFNVINSIRRIQQGVTEKE